MLYNRFDNLTNRDFGGENDGAKIFALRPLGGAVFDEKQLLFHKTGNFPTFFSPKTCPSEQAKNSCMN